MIDREKVIYDIERCISHVPDACRDCSHYTGTVGFGCMENLMSDALALLKEPDKEKSFIVIDIKTGKEADEYDIALHEDWAKHLCYCDMEGWAIESDGSLLLIDECGQYAYADRERFKVKWHD